MDQDIELAWEILSPDNDSVLSWFARKSNAGGGLADPQRLRDYRDWAARTGQDAYVGINACRPGFRTRPSTNEIYFVRGLVIDLDPVQRQRLRSWDPYCATSFMEEVIACAEDLLGIRLHPDRIDSGRGRQLWLRFEPQSVAAEEQKRVWRGAVGAFLHRLDARLGRERNFRVDTSCADIPRLVRLPGSINQKTGRRASFLGLGEPDSQVYRRILERFGVSSPPKRPDRPLGGEQRDWRARFHELTSTARRFLREGVEEPGRHAAAYATAKSLGEVGAGREATERAVLLGAGKCSPPLPPEEALRAVDNALKEDAWPST